VVGQGATIVETGSEGDTVSVIETAPPTIHRGEGDLPFVDLGDAGELQLLQVDLAQGVWVVRNRFQPGAAVQIHKHTGQVFAFTLSGSWHYLESADQVNRAGSYLFEPAGSIHTLVVPESNTEVTDVWFTIHGANLNLDADGNIESVVDAGGILAFYLALCEEAGIQDPPVVRDAD
jgi:2,4'-dihydroxyacetophenone dioxygenase